VRSPTARPSDAPTAIVGRKIPAGTCGMLLIMACKLHSTGKFTIIPNVQAVRAIFNNAVTIKRKTFSHIAVGLTLMLASTIGKKRKVRKVSLAQSMIVSLARITFLKQISNQFRGLDPFTKH
jgi:hypothetical protein